MNLYFFSTSKILLIMSSYNVRVCKLHPPFIGRHAGEHNRPFARELNLTFFLWYHLLGSLVDAYNKGCLSLEVDYGVNIVV
jgi:hypothetical protein